MDSPKLLPVLAIYPGISVLDQEGPWNSGVIKRQVQPCATRE
jgi:hypothetical protein